MLDAPTGPRPDLSTRQQIALDRIQELIATGQRSAERAWRNYYVLQGLTIGLAAITPCLIVLAKDNPKNELLNWLQLFFPAIAAISAGLSHIFHWREDAVRFTTLAESIRSQLWRYQTRSAEFANLSDADVLDRLVTRVDDLYLQSVARWSAAALSETPPRAAAQARAATAEH